MTLMCCGGRSFAIFYYEKQLKVGNLTRSCVTISMNIVLNSSVNEVSVSQGLEYNERDGSDGGPETGTHDYVLL